MGQSGTELIIEAQRNYGSITPCACKTSLQECFTVYDGRLILWFNTLDGSTHVVARPLA